MCIRDRRRPMLSNTFLRSCWHSSKKDKLKRERANEFNLLKILEKHQTLLVWNLHIDTTAKQSHQRIEAEYYMLSLDSTEISLSGFLGPRNGKRLKIFLRAVTYTVCLLYTSPSPRDGLLSRMPSSA
eukprot:TRINITY_DN24202_c0_g1_i2.p2 TRINITY_DN24202_c0_g1~~TRINITY_DN24202_c0_g1_i2.p2  ORF type:complete len:147 (-),score=29.49 TRINITY_DN24202_c0_g1_i2:11-391(-)